MKENIPLTFDDKNPIQYIDCKKIFFKEVYILKGDFTNMQMQIKYKYGNDEIKKKTFNMNSWIDINQPTINNIKIFSIDEEINNWHDCSNAIGKIELKVFRLNNIGEIKDNFKFIFSANIA